jgi:GT2 family glycosyltransferase
MLLKTSIIVTTYKTDTLYTQACLESIRKWKASHHELIVVTHDETPLLRAYLESCKDSGLIDKLIYTIHNHGHTRSFNLGLQQASHDYIVNICNDICVGHTLVDESVSRVANNKQLGLVGWFWYATGVWWEGDKLVNWAYRDETNQPLLDKEFQAKLRHAGCTKVVEGLGGQPIWIQLCNTAFFAARREVLGQGFSSAYHHYLADDFLNYQILDKGFDVMPMTPALRNNEECFLEWQYKNVDVEDRHRHEDVLRKPSADIAERLNNDFEPERGEYKWKTM